MRNIKDGFYIAEDELAAFAANTARGLTPGGTISGRRAAAAVRGDLRRIAAAHRRAGDECAFRRPCKTEEWLLDNHYLARREGLSAVAELEAAPRLRQGGQESVLSSLCGALERSGGGEVTISRIAVFLEGFQQRWVLDRRELALLTAGLKAALIRELAELCADPDGADPERMGRVFGSLRLLSTCDLTPVLENADRTEQLLRRDPAGAYPGMDERSRESYRRRVSELAIRGGSEDWLVARRVLELASMSAGERRHVGWWLFEEPLGAAKKRRSGGGYIAVNVLATLFLSLLIAMAHGSAATAILLLLPVSELVKSLCDFLALRLTPPAHIPRMELKGGVPPEGRTICVLSALLTGADSGKKLARRLEEYRLANRDAGANLLFGILADLPESDSAGDAEDAGWIKAAAGEIERLERLYGGFYLFCRPRVYCEGTGKHSGWERKRGAVLELARLLGGEPNALRVETGDAAGLAGVRYILTLDSDTRLCPGAARELIGAMLHPLNAPVLNSRGDALVRGHGLIHPRMGVELESAGRTEFTRIFAGQGGTDPYGCASGEVYMDLFGRGGFAGKGIIDAASLVACTARRIPDGLVLSHDALEGAYLRGGYMGDAELTDSCPASASAWFARLHRWARGDWQNSPWLFRRGRDLPPIERWKLFDSLRRTLVPPASMIAMLAGFFMPGGALTISALAALLAVASGLLLRGAARLVSRDGARRSRYHSTLLHGFAGGLAQAAAKLILLPHEGVVCLSAVFTALWRMLVTHKNLLEWRTAAQSETGGNTLSCFRSMWGAALIGLLCLLLSPSVIGRAAGVIWLVSPVYAAALGRPGRARPPLSRREREYLLGCAAEMWRYFAERCSAEDNFLPPDNFQEQPPVGVAHRTSPTNIGLCMVSALAAADCGAATAEEAVGVIERCLRTTEGLIKWRGHLYNWYDTRTLEPLTPAVVSTVDSGNLAACLTALVRGLRDYGRAELADTAQALLAAMDFAPLYDDSRRLFRIGWNVSSDAPAGGWYDLMASEARLTGYLAIARGDVERRHWRRLSRAQVGMDGYRGMASWTGTMFEYLMPELFLPCRRDCLLYESARFCLYVQKKRTGGGVWGCSESAFYSLDPALSYRYKAHGCAGLALKRGMDSELVVSPYSSFLALPLQPSRVVKNLQRLEELGLRGRYGFCEAVDLTPSRCPDGQPRLVRCYMAHHIGMSMAACANALCDGVMVRRFMADPAMSAHVGLLEEKVDMGGVLLRRREREIPEKPLRLSAPVWSRQGDGVNFDSPACCLLSNGVYSLRVSETGSSRAHAWGLLPYVPSGEPVGAGRGMGIFLEAGDVRRALLPERGAGGDFSWAFTTASAAGSLRLGQLHADCRVCVAPADCGELRVVTVVGAPEDAALVFEFEPSLAPEQSRNDHPAFWRLGLQAVLRDGALLIRRLPRAGLRECWLCAMCSEPASVSAQADGAALGWLSQPFVRLRAAVPETGRVMLALCMGGSADEALSSARRALDTPDGGGGDLCAACANLWGMSGAEIGEAMETASALMCPTAAGDPTSAAGQSAVWALGISGDLPLLMCRLPQGSDDALSAVKRHALLSACGLPCDLAVVTGDAGEYLRGRTGAVSELLRKLGREAELGARGGVHPVGSEADAALAGAFSANQRRRAMPAGERVLPPPDARGQRGCGVPDYRWLKDGSFSFGPGLPKRTWGNMLTNGGFGFFATDCGTGSMWSANARERRINPWLNDALAVEGAETLELLAEGRRHSLFAAPGDDCRMSFGFGFAVWEKTICGSAASVTAFVPPGTDARVLLVKYPGEASVLWQTRLVMSSRDSDGMFTVTEKTDDGLHARNPLGSCPEMRFTALGSAQPSGFTCDAAAWRRGILDGAVGAGLEPCVAAAYPVSGCLVLVCGTDSPEKLREPASPEAAERLLEETVRWWRERVLRLCIETPDPVLDRLMRGWTAYQALACRLMGRTSVYQSGGAFGFRDQLQDAVNLILLDSAPAREQILSCCAHQYAEGDVQHWWHAVPQQPDRGVRTRCSDDLLWLPWAVCEYVEKTGDAAVLEEQTPYLVSPPLADDERSRYEQAAPAGGGSVLEHCRRALDMAMSRGTDGRGLLWFGGGDWNDGMESVGGGSVWLTWFFAHTARRFAALCGEAGEKYLAAAGAAGLAANGAWDGKWYLRGFFDDGTPLGSDSSRYCKIDSVAQSFAAFCEEADPERLNSAITEAIARLHDVEHNVVRLFDPPFGDECADPGYIRSYGPGFRENGGQYTHGALWLALACFRTGRPDEGVRILRAVAPESHDMSVYGAEPYVLAADIYGSPDRLGEAGWSWYTGSAGWFFRITAEELLGLRLRGGELCVEPCLPAGWEDCRVMYAQPGGEAAVISPAQQQISVNKAGKI